MRSVAHFKGHPIHPMLIPFPIAFLLGGFACDVVAWLDGGERWAFSGALLTLAGMLTALAAGVPGFVDYLFAVPPHSSGKKRATYHMIVNLAVVALFAVAWIIRGSFDARPNLWIVLIELAGSGLLGIGGWLGGTLAYRNLIGVDHRYARAGKWTDDAIDVKPGELVAVAKADELERDQMKLLRINGERIVLARTEEGYCAFQDHCTHRGGSLAGGVLICGTVQCLWHGSQFDARTGAVKAGPAEKPITTYRVEERDGQVLLQFETNRQALRPSPES